jgi:site-specific DNA-cytosine methylase
VLARPVVANVGSSNASAMMSIVKLLVVILTLGWATPLTKDEILREIEATPEAPDFSAFFEPLAKLGRRLKVAAPCTGIHGCGEAFKHMKIDVDTCQVFDLEAGYAAHLKQLLVESGMATQDIVLNLGKQAGDLLNMPITDLKAPIDMIVAGPPCPPWAGQGLRQSTRDCRAKVFLRILLWVVFSIKCCGLIACVLENVLGITFEVGGREPVIYWWLEVLRTVCPEFEWGIEKLELVKYKSPQMRVRIFLTGMRKCVAALPNALPPFGPADIRSVLGHFPPTRTSLCANQAANLKRYEDNIIEMHQHGDLKAEDVVIISVDRAAGKVYKQEVTVNKFPTLTTHSESMMVLSVGDIVERRPDSEREFMRHVRTSEKFVAQGFPRKTHALLDSRCGQKAAGNAYPVNLMVAVLHPLVMALDKFDLAAWPPASVISSEMDGLSAVRAASALLSKPCKKVDQKKKAAQAAVLKRRKKRKKRALELS